MTGTTVGELLERQERARKALSVPELRLTFENDQRTQIDFVDDGQNMTVTVTFVGVIMDEHFESHEVRDLTLDGRTPPPNLDELTTFAVNYLTQKGFVR